MSALQVSPIGGVPAPAAGASPAGGAAATQKSTPTSTAAVSAQPNAASSAQAQAAHAASHASAATNAAAAQAAASENAQQDARIETPTLNLSVGLIGGSFDVYVDLTDSTDGRVVARLYGPKGKSSEPHPAPAHVRTEA